MIRIDGENLANYFSTIWSLKGPPKPMPKTTPPRAEVVRLTYLSGLLSSRPDRNVWPHGEIVSLGFLEVRREVFWALLRASFGNVK